MITLARIFGQTHFECLAPLSFAPSPDGGRITRVKPKSSTAPAPSTPPSATEILHKSGLRRTPVRLGVIDVLTKAARPLTVPQMLAKMKGVDSVTTYRTLNTFVKKGLVHRVRGEDRSWMYAIGDSNHVPEHQHPHFVCENCGKVECLEDSNIPGNFVKQMGVGNGYNVSYAEVVLHGTCPKCVA